MLRLATALAFLGFSAVYLLKATWLPLGTVEQPGPGLFPLLVGAFLLAGGIAFLFQCLPREPGASAFLPSAARRRVAGVGGTLVAFCLLLPWLGYGVTALGLLVALLRLFGLAHWGAAGGVALVATAASYYLFAVVLGVPLPAGVWSDW